MTAEDVSDCMVASSQIFCLKKEKDLTKTKTSWFEDKAVIILKLYRGLKIAIISFVFIPEKKLFYVGKDRKQDRLGSCFREEEKKVLRECHENDSGAHHGISRTLTLVESSYYWTSVTNDVKQWVWLMSLEYLNNVFTIYIQNSLLLRLTLDMTSH